MGFFNSLFKGAKSVFGGLSKGARSVYNMGNTIKTGISKGVSFAKKIPIIGDVVDSALNVPLPYVGMSANQLGSFADKGLSRLGTGADVVDRVGGYIPG